MKTRRASLLFLACLYWFVPAPLAGQSSLLDQIDFVPVAKGLFSPVAITHASDGSGRLFIGERAGRIVISDGQQVTATFLDIREQVSCCRFEDGLLSLAFHPNYENNGLFYVSYTDKSGEVGDLIISRFTVSPNPNFADANSEKVILRVGRPTSTHQAGHIEFGPDGFLYVSVGDGGLWGDPNNHAQRFDSLLGGILRIDIDSGDRYTIPPTNPFVDIPDARGEVWAHGLRNPWRFGFDRLTGDLYIGDVGLDQREEVNFQPSSSLGGENYGWSIMEGTRCVGLKEGCGGKSLISPILEYDHVAAACSGAVIGGYPYRGSKFPQLAGVYFYSDYCTGLLRGAVRVNASWLELPSRPTGFSVTSFGQEAAGELYVADARGGAVYRIVADPASPLLSPEISAGGVVSAATFSGDEALAPGSAVSVFGSNLAAVAESASAFPLPETLGQAFVRFNGSVAVPLFYASPEQVNIQLPWELEGQASALLTVTAGASTSEPILVPLTQFNPGLFSLDLSGTGQGAILIAGTGGRVAGPMGQFGNSRPARRGVEAVEIYATGLGPVDNPPTSGLPAELPLRETLTQPTVSIGGEPAEVLFSGLAPGLIALYQVNVRVPAGSPVGDSIELTLTIRRVGSNSVMVAID